MPILALILFHIIFFWRLYTNPFKLCTSEVASTFFPHWIWMGRQLRQGIFPAVDDIYYKYPGSIPFLATFYPPNLITSWLGSFLSLDYALKLYVYTILAHYLLGSLFAYYLFGNLFAALTLTYSAYIIKPFTPCFVYTMCWIPLAMTGNWVGVTMAFLSGYYPILVYLLPIMLLTFPLQSIIGLVCASLQLIPFFHYFRRSVRNEAEIDKNIGKIPLKHMLGLVFQVTSYNKVNGVLPNETSLYCGIAILLISNNLIWSILLICYILIATGLLPPIQRIPGRALYGVMFCIAMLTKYVNSVPLAIIQASLLMLNSHKSFMFPYMQWWDKPSVLYAKKPKSHNWPYITGYLLDKRISEYRGSFRLA